MLGGRSRTKTMVKELPPEIVLFNILPRLPAKSVLRFKSVSKQWHTFVTNPMFANMHLQHQNHHKLLIISTTKPYKFRTIDCEAPNDRLTTARLLPFDVTSLGNISIITSCNGLVCVGIKSARYPFDYSQLILWNPLTGNYKTLSNTYYSYNEYYQIPNGNTYLLYYIFSEDDYKLLHITRNRCVYIYSLKSDSWRKVESTEDFYQVSNYMRPYCESLDEKLYFLKRYCTVPQRFSIMKFDLKTEKFTEIEVPLLKDVYICYTFMLLKNHIHVPNIEWWEKIHGDWMKVITCWPRYSYVNSLAEPLYLMKNGNWLLHCEGNYLCSVDPEEPTISTSYTYKSMKIFPSGKYIETFVSPINI